MFFAENSGGSFQIMRLSDCKPGQGGTVGRIQGEPAIVQRLMEMGLIEGTSIKVIRVAPLGDPLEVEVQNYFLSLRKSEAAGIEVL